MVFWRCFSIVKKSQRYFIYSPRMLLLFNSHIYLLARAASNLTVLRIGKAQNLNADCLNNNSLQKEYKSEKQ